MTEPALYQEIGARLAVVRKALGHTQVMMARLLESDTNGQIWSNYESGRRRISIDHALVLSRCYGISLDWIYRGGDMPSLELRNRIQGLLATDL